MTPARAWRLACRAAALSGETPEELWGVAWEAHLRDRQAVGACLDHLRVRDGTRRTHQERPAGDMGWLARRPRDPGLRLDLLALLRELPRREGEIVRAVDLDGREQQEVARALGLSPGRVSQLRTTALDRLRWLAADYAEGR